ncbi:hypothetical protein T484DRAFT_1849761 [Baffinella frigidus]|nr:hypothetical protein T484DRAFT_1849761 [Cryptophyta sp. CCMP2293]
MEHIDALETIVKSMRSGRKSSMVDAAEAKMLDEIMGIVFNIRASKALGVCGKTMSEQRDGAFGSQDSIGRFQSSVSVRDYLPGLSDYSRKNDASRRMPTLEFKLESVPAPDFDWLNDTQDSAAVVFGKTPTPKPGEGSQNSIGRFQSSVSVRDYLPGLIGKNDEFRRMPTLEFRVESVPEPDFDWLNDTQDSAGVVFRKTPMPKPGKGKPASREWAGFEASFNKFSLIKLQPGAKPEWN